MFSNLSIFFVRKSFLCPTGGGDSAGCLLHQCFHGSANGATCGRLPRGDSASKDWYIHLLSLGISAAQRTEFTGNGVTSLPPARCHFIISDLFAFFKVFQRDGFNCRCQVHVKHPSARANGWNRRDDSQIRPLNRNSTHLCRLAKVAPSGLTASGSPGPTNCIGLIHETPAG